MGTFDYLGELPGYKTSFGKLKILEMERKRINITSNKITREFSLSTRLSSDREEKHKLQDQSSGSTP